MYGFIRIENKRVVVANRIFETQLYETFLASPETRKSEVFLRGDREKYQFITDDGLDMQRILERFVVCFDELYGDDPAKFLEDDGRRYFLLYLRPIINGTGNYYIEAQTRNCIGQVVQLLRDVVFSHSLGLKLDNYFSQNIIESNG